MFENEGGDDRICPVNDKDPSTDESADAGDRLEFFYLGQHPNEDYRQEENGADPKQNKEINDPQEGAM